ncbi:MAG: ABC transporter ATP-binding protein [Candidatus Heimdallarchaeota archaeon]|nr:ABC transporter ATP-binding protein [Candidatus Heimdallarchaeota archaeon]MBY8994312.1 ABC transporter ATP-binding protein [Candidatus Heimdallarchaeota archaeon]
MRQDNVIEISNLKKTYGSDDVLAGLSFTVKKGEIFSLMGPDGSGKTTTIEILVGLRKPSDGEISILDFNIKSKIEMREIKKQIGFLPQEFRTHDNLTVKENIQFWGKMYDNMIETPEILAILHLEEKANARYKHLTPSFKKRVGLAIAFVNDPQIVFLDEPTAGLDQFAKKEVWDIIKQFNKEGKTIFITTNDAIEPQAIADRVAIIHKGLMKDIGTPIELIDRFSSGNKIIIRSPTDQARQDAIDILQSVCPLEVLHNEIIISSEETTLLEILEKLDRAKVRYSDIITQKPTLNDVFITLTGEALNKN